MSTHEKFVMDRDAEAPYIAKNASAWQQANMDAQGLASTIVMAAKRLPSEDSKICDRFRSNCSTARESIMSTLSMAA
ncbi:MAG: hypothetical protein WCG83_03895 [Candidatus Peregrinibacteria bacterium]